MCIRDRFRPVFEGIDLGGFFFFQKHREVLSLGVGAVSYTHLDPRGPPPGLTILCKEKIFGGSGKYVQGISLGANLVYIIAERL